MNDLPARDVKSGAAISPYAALRDGFDHLFADFTRNFPISFPFDNTVLPSAELRETDDGLEVTLELPGVDVAEVKLTVEDHSITVSGEKKRSSEKQENGSYHSERTYGAFTRTFSTSFPINPDDVDARFDKGVLQIKVKKPEGYAGGRQIEIKH
jgi:HSP20 family protein